MQYRNLDIMFHMYLIVFQGKKWNEILTVLDWKGTSIIDSESITSNEKKATKCNLQTTSQNYYTFWIKDQQQLSNVSSVSIMWKYLSLVLN